MNLGKYHQFQLSLFYVHTDHSPLEAYNIVSQFTDMDDRLAVINAESGIVSTWDKPPIDAINAIWHQQ